MSKNRNDIAGQSIDIERHLCLGDTSVQMLHKLEVFMLETGHASQTGSLSRACSTSLTGKVRRCKMIVYLKWQLTLQVSDMVIGFSVVQDRKDLDMQNDHITSLRTVNGTNSPSG